MSNGFTQPATPFQELPTELVRAIFEIVAHEDKATALALVCTSRAVQSWIEPILYSTVPLLTRKRFKAFCTTIGGKNARIAEILSSVKALHLPLDDFKNETHAILARCPNAMHLAINAKQLWSPEHRSINIHPTRLILFGAIPDGCDFKLFSNVTHLSIFSVPVLVHLEASVFPVLTHFMSIYCLDNTPISIFIRAIQKTIRQREGYTPLRLMVINVCAAPARPDYDRSLELWRHEEELLQDNVLLRPSERLTLSEWEREAHGNGSGDRWTDAEKELERRKLEYFYPSDAVHSLHPGDRLLSSSPTPYDRMDADAQSDSGLSRYQTAFHPPTHSILHNKPSSLSASAFGAERHSTPRELERYSSEGAVDRQLKGSSPASRCG